MFFVLFVVKDPSGYRSYRDAGTAAKDHRNDDERMIMILFDDEPSAEPTPTFTTKGTKGTKGTKSTKSTKNTKGSPSRDHLVIISQASESSGE